MKHLIIYLSISLILFSCKKEPAEIIEQDEISWNDTQKVRILKVEQTVSPNSFPFDIDGLMTVEYQYNSEQLTQINIKRNGLVEYANSVIYEDGAFKINFNEDDKGFGLLSNVLLKNAVLYLSQNRIEQVKNTIQFRIMSMDAYKVYRSVQYEYNSDNLLETQTTFLSLYESEHENSEMSIGVLSYLNSLIKQLSVVINDPFGDFSPKTKDYIVDIDYQSADDIPDGLVRIVNQAIIGLSNVGLEGYSFFHNFYDYTVDNRMTNWDASSEYVNMVQKYKYTFADWIVSFGMNQASVIPNQGNQLIASKRIKGEKIVDGELDDEGSIINPVYANVDSTAHYPYTHHAESKILEIAGLKIYYELVE